MHDGLRACRDVFLQRQAEILSGAFTQSLIEESPCGPGLKQLKRAVQRECFSLDVVVLRELAGGQALRVLLEAFAPVALPVGESEDRKETRQTTLCRRFLERSLGKVWTNSNPDERLRWLLDFILGMTDRYALVLAKKLSGVLAFREV
jgi:dGTPase